MQFKFEVTIDTDEATAEELTCGIHDALENIEFENGDYMYCNAQVVLISES